MCWPTEVDETTRRYSGVYLLRPLAKYGCSMNATEASEHRTIGLLGLSLLAILTGIVAGFGAVAFRGLIAFVHNLLFLGKLSSTYESNLHTLPSPWGPFVILVPVVGAVCVAFLVKNFAPEAKGHGVPEVMDAIYYNRGIIRPVVAVVKSLASAISIGSGGSVGREGPIVQIGATFGSTVGQLLSIPTWQRVTLIASGAGAGIAATFNTPVGGVLFAVELMLHEVSARTIVPVVLATATATFIGRAFFGDHPAFTIPPQEITYFHLTSLWGLLTYAGLGLLLGLASMAFIKSIYGAEDFFEGRIGGGYYRQHLLGMFAVGIIIYVLMISFGHYYVQGVGYATIQDLFSGVRYPVYLILLLSALKLLATSLTLGSGASGGIFSPSLFLGATLGAAYGTVVHWLFPGLAINIPAFAVAGMAGVVGGATGAAMTAIVMLFEMTLDYNAILPAAITVAVSFGLRKSLMRDSIYTLKLVRRGHFMPQALQTDLHFLKPARDIMGTSFAGIAASDLVRETAPKLLDQQGVQVFLVVENAGVVGFVTREMLLAATCGQPGDKTLGEIAARDYVTVSDRTSLLDVLAKMRMAGASIALVLPEGAHAAAGNIEGVVTKQAIADSLADVTELFTG